MTAADPRLHGVLVTYRRPDDLVVALTAVCGQTAPPDHLVVVDNSPASDTRATVERIAPGAEYVAAPENLGPAGGIALGMERVLAGAADHDWVVVLDDDDPPAARDAFERLRAFGTEMVARDPSTGAIGLTGARFDRRRGRMVRVADHELRGAVMVDYVGGNQLPFYSVAAVRRAGLPRPELFFGFDDLEFGLRLRDHGYALYANGDTWYRSRAEHGRLGLRSGPSVLLDEPTWRRYYSLRNLVRILRDRGAFGAAARVTVVVGFAKPLANLPRDRSRALRHLRLNAAACRDGWAGRMGRTVEPGT